MNMEAAWSSVMLVSYHIAIWCHKPENHNFNPPTQAHLWALLLLISILNHPILSFKPYQVTSLDFLTAKIKLYKSIPYPKDLPTKWNLLHMYFVNTQRQALFLPCESNFEDIYKKNHNKSVPGLSQLTTEDPQW